MEYNKIEPTLLEWIALIVVVALLLYCGYLASERLYHLSGGSSSRLF